MYIRSVGKAHPQHYATQEELKDIMLHHCASSHLNKRHVEKFFRSVQVEGRHTALPLQEILQPKTFTQANNEFIRVGLDISEKAIADALDQAQLTPKDVDAIFFSSVTGIATPSLDARLAQRMGFREDVVRYPFFGLGCVAGAVGLSRVHDYLTAHPQKVALLLCTELCSLTFQFEDFSIENMVGTSLFADGSAAVVAVGEERAESMDQQSPKVIAKQSRLYPDSEKVMGWDIGEFGFKIVLSAGVPHVVKTYIAEDVKHFLNQHNCTKDDIKAWVCHPGGPKVIEAFVETLELEDDALQLTTNSLRDVGNMSSASVLFVLADTMELKRPAPGNKGMLMAMGPGFCSELLLMEW